MTISSTVRLAGPFSGTGLVTTYPFTFKVFSASDLLVVRTDSSNVDTNLVLTTDYTVSLNADQDGNPGGSVILNSALASGYTLNISSQVSQLQSVSITNNGGFYPKVIEAALDKLTVLIQQIYTMVTRSMQLPLSVSGVSTTLPKPSGGAVVGWNSGATALQNYSATDLGATIAYAAARTDIFSGTGAQTAFTLSNDPGSVNNCDVIVGTTPMKPGIDFTVSLKVITFTSAPASGTNNISVRYSNALTAIPAGAYSGSSRTVPVSIAYTSTVTVDASLSNVFYIGSLTGNTVLAINNPSDGQTINIRFVQDATGGRTVTLPGTVSVVGALVTTANYVDWLTLTYVSSSGRWEGCWSNATINPTTTGLALISAASPAAARTSLGASAVAVYASAAQSIATATDTKIQLNTKDIDTNSFFDAVTNYRFLPTVVGNYLFVAQISWAASGSTSGAEAILYKNGSSTRYASWTTNTSSSTVTSVVVGIMAMNGTTDYIELWGRQNTGGALNTVAGFCTFSATLIS
jgi:hypothetical protein